ncbi:MAG TPA: PAS domain S-box protein [Myxococcota bacterium]|nr:PAS domain S-box protein [Myxococcota bacterium]
MSGEPRGVADRDAARVVETARSIAVVAAMIAAAWLAAALLIVPFSWLRIGLALASLVGALASLAFALRSRPRAAAITMAALFWGVVATPILAGGGIQAPVHLGFVIPILIAGVLLGGRAALAVALLTVAFDGLVAAAMWRAGIRVVPPVQSSPLNLWASHATFYLFTAVLVGLVSVRIRAALRGAAESEAALQASEARHRQLAEHASDLISEWTADGRCRYVSPNVLEKLGDTPDEFMGGLDPARYDPDNLAEVTRDLGRSFASHHGGRSVLRARHRNGEWRSFEISANPYRNERGEFRIVVIGRDVTERLRSEEERAQLLLAMEQAAEGIVMLDARGVIRYANSAFASMLGRSVPEVVGRAIDETADGRGDHLLIADMREKLVRGDTWKGRYESIWSDDSVHVRDATISPVRDASGSLRGYVGVLRDVTREVQLEADLRQSQKLEALGRLAGGVAHDFNNLLTAISGCVETLLEEIPEAGEARSAADEIGRAVERSAALTRQLLAFSRGQPLEPRVIELNAVVARLESLLVRLLGEDVTLSLALDPAAGCVEIDPGQLEQVVMNLAVNARDAMPRGGRLSVATGVERLEGGASEAAPGLPPGSYVRLTVADTGTGMDAATRARVFEPFFTTKEPGRGTGLGLSLVHGVVHQSGGLVRVSSLPNAGASFDVLLPRVEAPEESGAGGAPSRGDGAASRLTGTVLLVEDEPSVRNLARRALEAAGLRVLTAGSGAEALELSDRHEGPIDVLVSDLVMPGMSGGDLGRELLRRRPGTRLVFMSGYPDPERGAGGDLPPHDAFLRKPFRPSELRDEVARVLR